METPRYRIGNDLSVFWAIHNRDGSPYDLEGKEVHLFVTNERGRKEVEAVFATLPDGTINNVIRWDFKGEDQRVLGLHTLTVEILESSTHREIIRDYCQAFELVGRSELETEEGDANISIGGDLILSSKLDIYRFEATNVDISGIKETIHDISESIKSINEDSVEIKVAINGIQDQVNDIGTELSTKASVDTVVEIGEQITEVQTNVAEQKIRVDGLESEISTKASAESVTNIEDNLKITNETLAQQVVKVSDLTAEVATKASAEMVTEIAEGLEITNGALAEQTLKVNALSAEVATKASAESVADITEDLRLVEKSVADQTLKVDAMSAEISTKASSESVLTLEGDIALVETAVAEQTVKVEGLEASIENLVTKETFNAATGEIEQEFTSVKQTTDSIEATVREQSGEITSIKENINGISVDIGRIEGDLGSLRDQLDGVTESFFFDYVPTTENEPAATWITEGKEAEHRGDTFTNTALEGEGAGKSWRWLQGTDGSWNWQPIADTDAQKALLLASQAQATADGKVTIFYQLPNNYKVGDIWFVHSDDYPPYKKGEILSSTRVSTIFNLEHWESKTRYTKAVEDLDEIMNTTFRDGVIDDAERKAIVESLVGLRNEKASVESRYSILVGNTDLTDTTLKDEFKLSKTAYDVSYDSLVAVIGQIDNASTDGLKDLFSSYASASDEYKNAYSAYNTQEAEVTKALMGRLNPANVYLDNIINDGILTPVEKEQLFEIYRGIAKEYDTTKGNAFNYKIWRYREDGTTEEAGLNGSGGRYDAYLAFKDAYTPVENAFSSSIWGFDKMDESTTLPEGYSISLLKGYLDAYYSALGVLVEAFSAITAAIEDAQKNAEKTLNELTGILTPEQMSTQVGKGVVLSTIIATRDEDGNITAGMNATNVHSDPTHGRVVIAGGVKNLTDWTKATGILYEDGHMVVNSGEFGENVIIGNAILRAVLDGDVNLLSYPENGSLVPLFQVNTENGKIVSISTTYDFIVNKNLIVHGDVASGGEGEDAPAEGTVTGIRVDANTLLEPTAGIIDMTDVFANLDISDQLENYYTSGEVDAKIAGIDFSPYAKTTDVADTYATKTALSTLQSSHDTLRAEFDALDDALNDDVSGKINTWNEIKDFLDEYSGSEDLATIISKINADIAKRAFQSDLTALATRVDAAEGNITSLTNGKADRSELSKYVLLEKASQTIKGDITIEGNLVITGDVASGGEGGNTSAEGTVTGVTVSGVDYTSVEAGLLDLTDLMALYALKSDSTKVSVSPSLSSGKPIGVISVDGVGTTLYAPATYAWSEISGKPNALLFGGTSSQFLKADGSVDSTSYLPTSGGVIRGAGAELLRIVRTDGNPCISFLTDSNLLGRLGFNTNGEPIAIVNTLLTFLLHSGNVGEYALKIDGSSAMAAGKYINWEGSNLNGEDYESFGYGIRLLSYDVASNNYRGGLSVGTRYGFQLTRLANADLNSLTVRFNAPNNNNAWSDWKTIAFTDSNVASATKLATARTIWGQSFDGTGDVLANSGVGLMSSKGKYYGLSIFPAGNPYYGVRTFLTYDEGTTMGSYEIASRTTYGLTISHAGGVAYDFENIPSNLSYTMLVNIRPSGNVGIGTTTPAYKLDVAGVGRFTDSLLVSGTLTANSGATITGDVTINGNLIVSGDVASGGTGQDTPSDGSTSSSGVLTLTGEIPEGSNIPQSSLDAIGLTDRVIADLLIGKYHHVMYTSGITTYCFVVSGQYNSAYKAFTLHWGDDYMDEFMGYVFSLGSSGGWNITIYEI